MKKFLCGVSLATAIALMGCTENSPLSSMMEGEETERVAQRDIVPGFIDIQATNYSYQSVSQQVDHGEFIKVSVLEHDKWKTLSGDDAPWCDYKGFPDIKGGRYAPMPNENKCAVVFDFCGKKRVLTKSYGEIFFATETDNLKARINEWGRSMGNNEGHIGVKSVISEADYSVNANELTKWTTSKIAFISRGGNNYEFVAQADWTVYDGVVPKHDADGAPGVNWNISSYPVPSGPVGALIGKVGVDGKPFVMGKRCTISLDYKGDLKINGKVHDTNVSSGGLYVVINDTPQAGYHADNVGTCYIGRFRI